MRFSKMSGSSDFAAGARGDVSGGGVRAGRVATQSAPPRRRVEEREWDMTGVGRWARTELGRGEARQRRDTMRERLSGRARGRGWNRCLGGRARGARTGLRRCGSGRRGRSLRRREAMGWRRRRGEAPGHDSAGRGDEARRGKGEARGRGRNALGDQGDRADFRRAEFVLGRGTVPGGRVGLPRVRTGVQSRVDGGSVGEEPYPEKEQREQRRQHPPRRGEGGKLRS